MSREVGSQVLTEIDSADAIDLVMAFIRRSGMRPLVERCDVTARTGGRCASSRRLTPARPRRRRSTSCVELGAEVRVSYDIATTRLHAKAWLFHRRSAFSTAYVGSSNLTHSAQVDRAWSGTFGVSGARNPDVVDKIEAVFDSYWESGDFVPYEHEQFDARDRSAAVAPSRHHRSSARSRSGSSRSKSDCSSSSRWRGTGHHRNLLVSATGTGKTVMAAVDYARLRDELPRARLLFVAHREEILDQSLATFRHALRDHAVRREVGGRRTTAASTMSSPRSKA